ncbi:MAG: hypothetical protein AAF433_22745, partial [Bacteroidota bacterium]
MKELEQLVSYVNPSRLRRLAFYKGGVNSSDSQLKKLYSAVSNGLVKNDAEASMVLFNSPKDSRYPKVKSRLKQQLAKTVILVEKENEKLDPFDSIYYECRQKLLAAELLRRTASYHAAFPLAKKALKLAEKADLADVAYRCCDILIGYYSFVDRIPKMRDYFIDQASQWHNQNKADYDAKLVYERYMGPFINDTKYVGNLIEDLTKS